MDLGRQLRVIVVEPDELVVITVDADLMAPIAEPVEESVADPVEPRRGGPGSDRS
jgi:hypothetical protein